MTSYRRWGARAPRACLTAEGPGAEVRPRAGSPRPGPAPVVQEELSMPPPPRTRRRRVRPALPTSARQPPEIVRGSGTTVHAQIEDWLAGEIAAGQLVPGDRLPTEHDLAGWFGVSRMTLR